jgi:RNA polymerase sigma-32 factor
MYNNRSDVRFNIDKYMKSANQIQIPSIEEQKALAFKMKAGDHKAKNLLIVANLRLVVKEAHKFRGYVHKGRITFSDMVQEGNMGLIRSMDKFDPSLGYAVGTYARWWIRAFISDYIVSNYNMIAIGTTQAERTLFFKLSQITSLLDIRDATERAIATQALAEKYKVRPEDIHAILSRFINREMSTNEPVRMESEDTGHTLEATLSHSHNTEELVSQHQSVVDFYKLWEKIKPELKEKECRIIERRWLQEEGCTLREVGEEYGLSRERIRQIEAHALTKLKTLLETHKYQHHETTD